MTSIAYSPVTIQTSSRSAPSVPTWFGEMVVVAHYLTRNQGLAMVNEQVRLARGRFGHYEVIDFFAVLLGYAFSGEPTLEAFFTHVRPFAPAFMALFGRDRLPHRSTLSRFLADVDLSCIEELRQLFLQDLLARPGTTDGMGGLWDRQGQRWLVFDIDGTRQTARQRPLPQTGDLPPARRRLRSVCAPGYVGRKRGEMVCTRTAVLQAHTHQWLGTFAGAGNGDYRGDLRRAVEAIGAYLSARHVPFAHGVVRLDGQYGNAAIVEELAGKGLGWVMRGRDYHLLDVPQVRARLRKPADQHTTHPETQTRRDLFDCPEIPFTVDGRRMRVIVATHPVAAAPSPIGVTRDGVVHELFFTSLPLDAFTPADVVALYLHRGAFETVLCDEDEEQDPDRWCSHTPHGQAFWHILSQWAWNLRQELGHHLHPTAMRQTEFAPAQPEGSSLAATTPPPICYGPPQWASLARIGTFAGQDFTLQSDGSLRCPAGQPLYPQERRLEHNGTDATSCMQQA